MTKINYVVYISSSLVLKILSDAHEKGKIFRVIVVDSRPKLEGTSHLIKIKCLFIGIGSNGDAVDVDDRYIVK